MRSFKNLNFLVDLGASYDERLKSGWFATLEPINNRLHYLRRSLPADFVRDNAARLSVNNRDDKRGLVIARMKVNISSISNMPGLSLAGAAAFFVLSCE